MIDERLQEKWNLEQRKTARAALDGHPRLADLDAWIATWWERWEATCPRDVEQTWPADAVVELRATRPGADETSLAAETTIVSRGRDSPNNASGTLLLAGVVGRLTGSGPRVYARFERAERIAARRSSWANEFFASFAEAAASHANEWILELAAFPGTLEACCGSRFGGASSDGPTQLREEEARRTAAGETANLWDFREPRDVEPRTSVAMRLRALFVLSPAAATTTLERIPSTSLRYLYRYFLGIGDDIDAIIRGIEASPLLWANGAWTGNAVAPLFIHYATNYGMRMMSAVERENQANAPAIEAFRKNELPQLFRRVVATVLARADGKNLAMDYASHLVYRTSWSRNQHEVPVERTVVAELIDGLRAAGVRPTDVRRLARRRLPQDARWHQRACFQSVAGYLVADATMARNTWAEFVALLLDAGEDDITGIIDPSLLSTHMFGGFGYALANTESPIESWKNAWRELYPRRERARFAVLAGEGLLSSIYLALAGLAALEPLVVKNDHAAAKALLAELMPAFRALACAPRTTSFGVKMHQLAALPWAFVSLFDRDAWKSRLSSWAGYFTSDPAACLFAADLIRQNGVPVNEVVDAMRTAGCDPLMLARQLVEWMQAKGFGTDIDEVELTRLLDSFQAA